jgi:hypothetical protein
MPIRATNKSLSELRIKNAETHALKLAEAMCGDIVSIEVDHKSRTATVENTKGNLTFAVIFEALRAADISVHE